MVFAFRLHTLASGGKSDLISFFLDFTAALQVNTELGYPRKANS